MTLIRTAIGARRRRRSPAAVSSPARAANARDVVARRDLGRAHEQGVGEARVVGHRVGQDEAGEDAAARAGARWTPAAFGTRTANSLRYGPACSRGAPTAARARLELGRPGRAERRDIAQPVRPERRQIDAGRERQQRLVRADVAGGLVAPDVLLARLQGHDEGALAVEVRGHADEPAGDLADERVGRGEDPEVRAAVLRRDAERLALPRRDVRAVGARRREHGQADRARRRPRTAPRRRGRAGRSAGIGSSRPKKSGCAGIDPGHRAVRVGEQPLERREVRRAGAVPSATSGISSSRGRPRSTSASVCR